MCIGAKMGYLGKLQVCLPVAFAATVLLGLLGINTIKAVLGKELGNILLRKNSTLGNAGVVLVVELVRSSHCKGQGYHVSNMSCMRYQERAAGYVTRKIMRWKGRKETTPSRNRQTRRDDVGQEQEAWPARHTAAMRGRYGGDQTRLK
jgi:hypothetical protein